MSTDDEREEGQLRFTRRTLLKGAGALVATTAVSSVLASCETDETDKPASPTPVPVSLQYPEVPYTPMQPPDPSVLRTFTPREAQLVDALTSRIMPGTPDDPGAHEAGVTTYIDNMLADSDGFPEKTYTKAPFAMTYDGDTPPDGGGYATIWVPTKDIQRYGYQSLLTPREVYRIGLASVERFSMSRHGASFLELSERDQDGIIGDMANDQADGFDDPMVSGLAFFHTLRRHTSEGMFSDPVYGGNRDLVGWKLVGYPGAQRAYSPDEIRSQGIDREPQSIMAMMPFMPGEKSDSHVILPVTGSDDDEHQ
jgi:hypothetical protein